MDNLFIAFIIKLAILTMFVSSMIEVVKGISAIGVIGLIKGLVKTLWHNEPMVSDAFPALNFCTALLVCWAFNITAMAYVFGDLLKIQSESTATQIAFARWLDYFGTASLIYLGGDQLFKRVLSVEKGAKELVTETEKLQSPAEGQK